MPVDERFGIFMISVMDGSDSKEPGALKLLARKVPATNDCLGRIELKSTLVDHHLCGSYSEAIDNLLMINSNESISQS